MSIADLKYHTHTHTYAHTGKETNELHTDDIVHITLLGNKKVKS